MQIHKIGTALSSKPKSTAHLQSPNYLQLLKLCYSHQQIVTQFGYSKTCRKFCTLCSICQKHHWQDNKHQYINIKQFISLVQKIKQKYRSYHKLYVKQVIPEFLGNLVQVVMQFIKGLEMWNQETSLVSNFLNFTKNKKIHNILQSKMDEWNLESLTCQDICELKMVSERVQTLSIEQIKQEIVQDLQGLFNRVLTNCNIVPQRHHYDIKKQQNIQGNIQYLSNKLKQFQQKLPKLKKQGLSSKTNLIVNLTQQMIQQTPPSNQSNVILQQLISEKQQQQNIQLANMIQILVSYIKAAKHQNIEFISRIRNDYGQFWEFFINKFMELALGNIKMAEQGMKTIYLYIPKPQQIWYRFNQLFKKYLLENNSTAQLQLEVIQPNKLKFMNVYFGFYALEDINHNRQRHDCKK